MLIRGTDESIQIAITCQRIDVKIVVYVVFDTEARIGRETITREIDGPMKSTLT